MIDGEEPQLFDIVIEKLLNQNEPDGKYGNKSC